MSPHLWFILFSRSNKSSMNYRAGKGLDGLKLTTKAIICEALYEAVSRVV